MTKKGQDTITVTKITITGTIVVAIISLIGNLFLGYWQFILKPGEVSQLTPTPSTTTLAIEQIPQDIFAYAGNNNPDGGSATFVLIVDDENIPNYKLDYSLPNDKYGYAGLAFNFHGNVDLSEYNAIECIIIFSQPLDEINLYVKDIGNNFNTIRIVSNGSGEMALRYEFKNFPNINFNVVKEIGLVASTDFSTGTHQVVVKTIRFIK